MSFAASRYSAGRPGSPLPLKDDAAVEQKRSDRYATEINMLEIVFSVMLARRNACKLSTSHI